VPARREKRSDRESRGRPQRSRTAPPVGSARPARSTRRPPRDSSRDSIERVLGRQDWSRVRSLIPRSAADPALALGRLREFCARVITWNRRVSNLISKNDEARIVARHLVESLAHAKWLVENDRDDWIDFGSGPGFPALPLAIVGVGSRWTLVESRRIKTLFLRKTLGDMGIENGKKVINARLESVAESGSLFNGFTARAAGDLGETLRLAAGIVTVGGSAFLWKGSRGTAEMEASREWATSWDFDDGRAIGEGGAVLFRFIRRNR